VINEFADKSWGEGVIKGMGMDGGNKFENLGILAAMWFALQIATFFIMKYGGKEKR